MMYLIQPYKTNEALTLPGKVIRSLSDVKYLF